MLEECWGVEVHSEDSSTDVYLHIPLDGLISYQGGPPESDAASEGPNPLITPEGVLSLGEYSGGIGLPLGTALFLSAYHGCIGGELASPAYIALFSGEVNLQIPREAGLNLRVECNGSLYLNGRELEGPMGAGADFDEFAEKYFETGHPGVFWPGYEEGRNPDCDPLPICVEYRILFIEAVGDASVRVDFTDKNLDPYRPGKEFFTMEGLVSLLSSDLERAVRREEFEKALELKKRLDSLKQGGQAFRKI